MSKENVKIFFEAIEKDQELKENFLETVKMENDPEIIIAFAGLNGFNFSCGDIREFFQEIADRNKGAGKLDDADLESVVGGGLASESARWLGEIVQRIIHGKNLF